MDVISIISEIKELNFVQKSLIIERYNEGKIVIIKIDKLFHKEEQFLQQFLQHFTHLIHDLVSDKFWYVTI